MKKILLSLGMIVFVGAVVAGATGAFFSDSETSTGNTFTAGDIDLRIDNESYVIDYNIDGFVDPTGALVFSTSTSWELKDLVPGEDHFFDFEDLKPGDYGEDTISIHVGSNDAWMCAAAQLTEDADNDITEPEDESDADLDNKDATENNDGDLDTGLFFAFWVDDGDNVFETGETASTTDGSVFLEGSLGNINDAGQIALADSQSSILGNVEPIPGGTDFYIGKFWCFGELIKNPVQQDGFGKTGTNGPTERGTGFLCNGSQVGNEAQTDSVVGDLQFYATQARNNGTFLCEDWDPVWPPVQVQ